MTVAMVCCVYVVCVPSLIILCVYVCMFLFMYTDVVCYALYMNVQCVCGGWRGEGSSNYEGYGHLMFLLIAVFK